MNERQRKKRFKRDNTRRHALIDKKFSVIDGIDGAGLTPGEDRELERLQEGMDALMPKRVRRAEASGLRNLCKQVDELRNLRIELEELIASRKQAT